MRLQLGLLLIFSTAGFGQDRTANTEVAGDHFSTGNVVRVQYPVSGDLIAAGGNVNVNAEVQGDAVLAGGNIRVESPVREGGIYAAGGRVWVNSRVARNVRVAGGSVEIGPGAILEGNASLAGGQVEVLGAVKGYVQARGGSVYLNGPVDGEVRVSARSLELGPNTRITGKLIYATETGLKRDGAAQTNGGIERLTVSDRMERGMRMAGIGIAWLLGLMLLGGVLAGLTPGMVARVSSSVRSRPWMDILLGLIALACIPVAVILLFVTVVGLPLGMLLGLGYLALLLLGFVMAGVAIGEISLRRLQPAHAGQRSWQIAAAVVGVVIIALLSAIPYVGGLVAAAALLMGIGAIVSQFGQLRRGTPQPGPV